MQKITVLRLSGCSHCEELIEKLEATSIIYTSIDADENGSLADTVENLLNVYIYPIVILKSSNNITYYVYRSNSSEEEIISQDTVKIGVTSVDTMLDNILNFTQNALQDPRSKKARSSTEFY